MTDKQRRDGPSKPRKPTPTPVRKNERREKADVTKVSRTFPPPGDKPGKKK